MTQGIHMPITTFSPILCLWKMRSFFIGKVDEPLNISTGASTLVFSLDKPIRFITSAMIEPIQCRSILISAGTSITIDTGDAVMANITLDPMGLDFSRISKLMKCLDQEIFFNILNEDAHMINLRKLCTPPLNHQSVYNYLEDFFSTISIDTDIEEDSRIETVVTRIQQTIHKNLSLIHLADSVNLSPAYLTELFKQYTGLPIRRYRLWHRVFTTVLSVTEGKSLTNAAIEAGFTDSSHFNRTFRSMIGITPTSIFVQKTPLQIIPAVSLDHAEFS